MIKTERRKIDKNLNGRPNGFEFSRLPVYHVIALLCFTILPFAPIFGSSCFNIFTIFCALPVLPFYHFNQFYHFRARVGCAICHSYQFPVLLAITFLPVFAPFRFYHFLFNFTIFAQRAVLPF